MKRRRVVMLRVLAFLLLGAIVNVAVAWGCALFPSPASFNQARVSGHFDFVDSLGNRTWLIARLGSLHLIQFAPVIPQPHELPTRIDEATYLRILPSWSRFAIGSPTGKQTDENGIAEDVVVYEEDACGWPAYAFRSSGQRTGTGADFRTTGWRFQQGLPLWFRRMHLRDSLPAEPILPGFAINTVFYAVILWLLFAAPFALRRRSRRRRGLCVKCGYDLRGGRGAGSTGGPDAITCPECGLVHKRSKT